MLRLMQKPVSFFSLALVLAAVPIWWLIRVNPAPAMAAISASVPDAVNATEKQVALMRAGLDAQSLAAAGVSAAAISALAQALNAHFASNLTALGSAQAAVSAARQESDRLLRLIQAGKANQEQVAQYQAQKAALAAATAQHEAALDAVFTAATSGLNPNQRATLSAIRANAANDEVPVEFRTVTRSKAEWLQLRDDLANERISAKDGVPANPEGQSRLGTARANVTVAAARSALDANLAAVAQALTTAVAAPSDH